VPYAAPQGRRIHGIGGYFTHGPAAGRLACVSFASLPKTQRHAADPEAAAAQHGLSADAVGVSDGQTLTGYLWCLADRPADAGPDWQRTVPLEIWLDNDSVHKSETVRGERAQLERANVTLRYLPASCPELSEMEHVWQDVKHHWLPQRSYQRAGELKAAVDLALSRKATALMKTSNSPVATA
jgi:hypothetical protein